MNDKELMPLSSPSRARLGVRGREGLALPKSSTPTISVTPIIAHNCAEVFRRKQSSN